MVDVDKINRDLYENFEVDGSIKIDPSTGVVDVEGNIHLNYKMTHLPVTFGTVTGNFIVSNRGLTSLKGSPQTVGGSFVCWQNPITSLEHAPLVAKEAVYTRDCLLTSLEHCPQTSELYTQQNPLQSLNGLPDNLKFVGVTYNPDLGLLRLLQAQKIQIYSSDSYDRSDQIKCYQILNKYTGQGKPGAIRAAAELIRAGLKGVARW